MKRQISPHTRLLVGCVNIAVGAPSLVFGLSQEHRTVGFFCLFTGVILVLEWAMVADRLRRKK